jgi:hypothetical protein
MNSIFIIPVVGTVAVFTFVAIATWSENRRKEREAFYRHETYRKMLEQPQGSAEQILQLMRQEELQKNRRRLEGIRLGGMITLVSGVGVMVFLYFLVKDEPLFLVGVIPVLVGLMLVVYGYVLAPNPAESGDLPA